MMMNIFIPTDFSDCAEHAMQAGFMLARKLKANIHLFHGTPMPENWDSMSHSERAEHPELSLRLKHLERKMTRIKKSNSDVMVISTIAGGLFYKFIEQYTLDFKIDLVVMGSHGVSGKTEYFLGSNTQRVIRTLHCPVLVIKEPLASVDFKNVVYASAFNVKDQSCFLHFKKLIAPFKPKIHLLSIQPMTLFAPPKQVYRAAMEEFVELAHPIPCQLHITKDFSVERGVRLISEDLGADLIAVSNHHRHPLKRIFSGSSVEFLANHSDLPVLSIDYLEDNEDI